MVSLVRSRPPLDLGALLDVARAGVGDAFFSLKTFLSAILAYYIALKILLIAAAVALALKLYGMW